MSISKYSVAHRPGEVILRDLPRLVARDRTTLVEILAHIAEVDSRRLYVPAAYSSTVAYCMGELRLSEDSALKRIRVARAAQEFPAIYEAIASGGLSLTAVVMLKPHLTHESLDELLAAAQGKSISEIEVLVARLKQPELRAASVVVSKPVPATESAPSADVVSKPVPTTESAPSAEVVSKPVPATESPVSGSEAAPPVLESPVFGPTAAPQVMFRASMDTEIQDLLRHAQDLLSHRVPSGSPSEVLKRALQALIRELERRKFAAADKPRPAPPRSEQRTRHIPAHVKRAVRERDGFRCTFVSEKGRRCESRNRLEFDHVLEFARGGEATVDGIRLRCHAHNQFTAEQTFGQEFMKAKRRQVSPSRAVPASAR